MLTMKDIVREGHPVLREIAEEVTLPATEEDKKTLESMLQYVINSQDPIIAEKYGLRSGIGLAAPQIGVSKRMIAVHLTDSNISCGIFNPKIISHSVEMTNLENGEGCLSVDRDIKGLVPRYSRITVTGTTLDGEEIKWRLRGLPAIVFQHEIDHLNGIMFYDRIEEFEDELKRPVSL